MKILYRSLFAIAILGVLDIITMSVGRELFIEYYDLSQEGAGLLYFFLFDLGYSSQNNILFYALSWTAAIIHNGVLFAFILGYLIKKQYKTTKNTASGINFGLFKNLHPKQPFVLKDVTTITVVVTAIVLFANYWYTFSGFVAYSPSERNACEVYKHVMNSDTETAKIEKSISKSTEADMRNNMQAFQNGGMRCKPIQQFYIESIFILSIAGLLIWLYKRKRTQWTST